MGNLDKYATYTRSYDKLNKAIQEQKERLANQGGGSRGSDKLFGFPQFKMKDPGEYLVRILPAKLTDHGIGPYYRSLSVYFVPVKPITADDTLFSAMVIDPENYGRRGVMGEERKRLMFHVKDGTPEQKKTIRRTLMQSKENKWLGSSPKHFAALIPMDMERFLSGDRTVDPQSVHVMMYGNKIEKELDKAWKSRMSGGDFTHPVEGFPIVLHKTSSGSSYMDVDYSAEYNKANAGFIGGSEAITDAVLDNLPDLAYGVSEAYQWGYNGCLYTNSQVVMLMHGLGKPEEFRQENADMYKTTGVVTDPAGDKWIAELNRRLGEGITEPFPFTLSNGTVLDLCPDYLIESSSSPATPPPIQRGKAVVAPTVQPTHTPPDDEDIPF